MGILYGYRGRPVQSEFLLYRGPCSWRQETRSARLRQPSGSESEREVRCCTSLVISLVSIGNLRYVVCIIRDDLHRSLLIGVWPRTGYRVS